MRLIKKRSFKTSKFVFLLIPYSLIYLSDSIITFIFPIQLEKFLSNKEFIGLFFAITAIGSLVSDYLLSTFLARNSWLKNYILATLMGILFPITLFLGSNYRIDLLFLFSALIGGIYFEFFSFAVKIFILKNEKSSEFVKDFSIINIIGAFIDTVAPFIGSFLLVIFLLNSPLVVIPMQLLVLFLLLFDNSKKIKPSAKSKNFKDTFIKDLAIMYKVTKSHLYWIILSIFVWGMDSMLWTYGALWSIQVFNQTKSWIITSIYQFLLFIIPFVLFKIKFPQNLKLISFVFISFSTLSFVLSGFIIENNNIIGIIFIIFGASFLSLLFPFTDNVFANLSLESGKDNEEKVIGITRIIYGIAYLVFPTLGGFISHNTNYSITFVIISLSIFILICLIYLYTYFTKNKSRL